MATITLRADYHDPGGYIIPVLGDLVLTPGDSAEVTDEEADGFLSHPDITVTGLTPPVAQAPAGTPGDENATGATE